SSSLARCSRPGSRLGLARFAPPQPRCCYAATITARRSRAREGRPMRYVLFVCTHNAGRSQIAQAFFERYAPPDLRAESAGQEPAEAIWPNGVEAMREAGIDISTRRPK